MNNPIISAEELNTILLDDKLIILDCSLKEKHSSVRQDLQHIKIKNSRLFNLEDNFSDKNSPFPNTILSPEEFQSSARKLGIDNSSILVVYDNLGIYSSPRVWWMLKSMGHKNVRVLDGGLPEWVDHGYEVEPISEIIPEVGDFTVDFDNSKMKSTQEIIANINTGKSVLIDARSEGRFNGTAPEPRKELKSGSIPDSCNLPFQEVIREGKMIPPNELLTLFEKLNISDKPLIFTCGSGLTACIILLAAEMVHSNHKSVYDGSWTEWAEVNGLKVNN